MIFTTFTKSIYEIDRDNKRIRRLTGAKPATERQGDGEWRPYQLVSLIEVGSEVFIEWPTPIPLLEGSPSEAVPMTITSSVISIVEETTLS